MGHKGKGLGGNGRGDLEVFVKNMSFETTPADLRKHFAACGSISQLKMPMVGEGRCMGFAWITFKSAEALTAALALNNGDLGGRRLFVEKSGQHKKRGG